MPDLTYTAIGTFDGVTGNMTLELMIPEEQTDNGYDTMPQYDFSQKISANKDLNCVLCLLKLKEDDGARLFANKYNIEGEIVFFGIQSSAVIFF